MVGTVGNSGANSGHRFQVVRANETDCGNDALVSRKLVALVAAESGGNAVQEIAQANASHQAFDAFFIAQIKQHIEATASHSSNENYARSFRDYVVVETRSCPPTNVEVQLSNLEQLLKSYTLPDDVDKRAALRQRKSDIENVFERILKDASVHGRDLLQSAILDATPGIFSSDCLGKSYKDSLLRRIADAPRVE